MGTMKYSSASTLALFAVFHQSQALTRPQRQASLLAIPQEPSEHRQQLEDGSSGLLVDGEGNLYYHAASSDNQNVGPSTSSPTSLLASRLRGGGLSVDNEGNFFTPLSEIRSSKARATVD